MHHEIHPHAQSEHRRSDDSKSEDELSLLGRLGFAVERHGYMGERRGGYGTEGHPLALADLGGLEGWVVGSWR